MDVRQPQELTKKGRVPEVYDGVHRRHNVVQYSVGQHNKSAERRERKPRQGVNISPCCQTHLTRRRQAWRLA